MLSFKSRKWIWLFAGVSLYLFGMMLFAMHQYTQTIKLLTQQVDSELTKTAVTATALLNSYAKPTQNNALNQSILAKLASGMSTDRLYILHVDLRKHTIKLAASSDVKLTLLGLEYIGRDSKKINLFTLSTPKIANVTDGDLKYRSALVPFNFRSGQYDIAIADMSAKYLSDVLVKGAFNALFYSSFLLIIAIPMMWILYRLPIKTQLNIDPLTNLPNRMMFQKSIASMQDPMLILLNIDSFKELNDFYGTQAGDYVLKELVQRCLANLPNDLKLCRLSGDEFAIYGHNSLAHRGYVSLGTVRLEDWLKRLQTAPFIFNNEKLYLEVTAGVAVVNENIVEKASMALKAARMENKPYVIYDAAIKIVEAYQHNILWTSKLRQAIELDRIIPYFQPIINAKTDETDKYECLARMWDNGKVILPKDFLGVAYKSNLYPHITRMVMEKSFEIFWDINIEFSINLTAGDLADRKTRGLLISHLREFPRPEAVILELIGSDASENYDSIKTDIGWAKSVGAKIAIDNFGSGHSNFKPLLMLPIDYIKLDGSLIEKLDVEYHHQVITTSIIDLAHKLNIRVVAESVHSEAIYAIVKKLGVDYAQGYYLGVPKARPERVNRNY